MKREIKRRLASREIRTGRIATTTKLVQSLAKTKAIELQFTFKGADGRFYIFTTAEVQGWFRIGGCNNSGNNVGSTNEQQRQFLKSHRLQKLRSKSYTQNYTMVWWQTRKSRNSKLHSNFNFNHGHLGNFLGHKQTCDAWRCTICKGVLKYYFYITRGARGARGWRSDPQAMIQKAQTVHNTLASTTTAAHSISNSSHNIY